MLCRRININANPNTDTIANAGAHQHPERCGMQFSLDLYCLATLVFLYGLTNQGRCRDRVRTIAWQRILVVQFNYNDPLNFQPIVQGSVTMDALLEVIALNNATRLAFITSFEADVANRIQGVSAEHVAITAILPGR